MAILLLAFFYRFVGLGVDPLQADEARQSFGALSALRGGEAGPSPLLTFAQTLLFFLFGASDATARLVPALVGTSMVALPLLLSREIGIVGSRTAMLLLAISPTMVHFSRRADPSIIVAALGLALVALYARDRRGIRHPRYLVPVIVGMLLAAGPLAVTMIVAAAVFVLVDWRSSDARDQSFPIGRPSTNLVLTAAAVWFFVTTVAFSDFAGVQSGLIDSLSSWFGGIAAGAGLLAALHVGKLLIVSEFLPLALALVGWMSLRQRSQSVIGKSTLAAIAAVAVMGVPIGSDPSASAVLLVTLLCVLAGLSLDAIHRQIVVLMNRRETALAVSGGLVLLAGGTIALNHVTTPSPKVPDLILLAPVLLTLASLAAYWYFGSPRRVAANASIVAAAAMVLLTLHLSGFEVSPTTRPDGLLNKIVTSTDVRTMARDVRLVAEAKARLGQPGAPITLGASVAWPATWYMRDIPGQQASGAADVPAVAITGSNEKPPAVSYASQTYQMSVIESDTPSGWKETWRWLAFRESPIAPASVRSVVHVRGASER